MLPPIRRVTVEIRPETYLHFNGGVTYRARLELDAGGTAYAQEMVILPDDFTSRFDWMIEYAKQTIQAQIERDSRPHTQESERGQTQKAADAPFIHAED